MQDVHGQSCQTNTAWSPLEPVLRTGFPALLDEMWTAHLALQALQDSVCGEAATSAGQEDEVTQSGRVSLDSHVPAIAFQVQRLRHMAQISADLGPLPERHTMERKVGWMFARVARAST